jgi:hypothetical protein
MVEDGCAETDQHRCRSARKAHVQKLAVTARHKAAASAKQAAQLAAVGMV